MRLRSHERRRQLHPHRWRAASRADSHCPPGALQAEASSPEATAKRPTARAQAAPAVRADRVCRARSYLDAVRGADLDCLGSAEAGEHSAVQPQRRLLHVRRLQQPPDRAARAGQHAGDRRLDPDLAEHAVHAIVAVDAIAASGASRASAFAASPAPGWQTSPAARSRARRRSPRSSSRTFARRRVTAPWRRSWSRPAWHSSSPPLVAQEDPGRVSPNTIYFGNGALGIEAAARVYFGWAHGRDPVELRGGRRGFLRRRRRPAPEPSRNAPACLTPAQAALLAGHGRQPERLQPSWQRRASAVEAKARRDLVLYDMYEQHYISQADYEKWQNTPLPTADQIKQPQQQPSAAPYFTSWVRAATSLRALERPRGPFAQAAPAPVRGLLRRTRATKLSIDLDDAARGSDRSSMTSSPRR